jgi:hypothetical protein
MTRVAAALRRPLEGGSLSRKALLRAVPFDLEISLVYVLYLV